MKVQAVVTSVGVRSASREKAARVVSCYIPNLYLDNQCIGWLFHFRLCDIPFKVISCKFQFDLRGNQ